MDKQDEILKMMDDDAAAKQEPAAKPTAAVPDAAVMDLTPAAIVNPTDLDKKPHKKGKTAEEKTNAVVGDADAAEKKRRRRQREEEAKEQEETMRIVLGNDGDGEDDEDGEEPVLPRKKSSSSDSKKPKPKPKVKKTPAEETKKAQKKKPASEDKDKKKPKKPPTEVEPAEAMRRQPGHAMIKAEYDRLTRALDALVRKRVQREESNGGMAPTSVCGILINNLVDFYEQDVLVPFERKFARYMN